MTAGMASWAGAGLGVAVYPAMMLGGHHSAIPVPMSMLGGVAMSLAAWAVMKLITDA